MTFETMVDTVETWIHSCKSEEQLNNLQDVIDEFIFKRFKNHVSPGEMSRTLSYLQGVVTTTKKLLTAKNTVTENLN